MKKVVNFIAVLLIVIGTAPIAAASDPNTTENSTDFKVWESKKGTYYMRYKNLGKQIWARIRISNDRGRTLYTGSIKSENGFIKPFDLSRLPAGSYTFTLLTGKESYNSTIKILSPKELYGESVSIEKVADKQFDIAVEETPEVDLSVIITNESGDLLYEGAISEGSRRRYDVSKVKSHQVSVAVYKSQEIVKESTIEL